MKINPIRVLANRSIRCIAGIVIAASAITAISAKPVPDNLGNGLNKIVENKLLQEGKIAPPAISAAVAPKSNVATKNAARDQANYIAAYKANVAKDAAKADAMAIADRTTAASSSNLLAA